ncbi:transposase [Pelomonas sp. Root1444]|uniref:transposase n=1 Tax=Pelomonas sp. Root1444 TaxID=1736464 RepID=UPI0009EA4CBE
MDQAAPSRRRRRVHSAGFKAQAVQAAQRPGVSMAAVAMAHRINASLLRRWVHERAQPRVNAVPASDQRMGFVALPMPAPSAPSTPSAESIRIKVRRGLDHRRGDVASRCS